MCEEAKIDGGGVSDWEAGLPSFADLTPLSQSLIPANLASAFKISPEPTRTAVDVNLASQTTISSLRGGGGTHSSATGSDFKPCDGQAATEPEEGSDPKKTRRMDPAANELAAITDNFMDDQSISAKALKRPRLVWTPQLHKRFVEVVAHLGLKNAVPKTIMQLMNVEGLTRENVASHLQKYRLYVKRMQGSEGPSPSDHLFASTPLPPQSFNKSSSVGPSHGNAPTVCNGSTGNNCGGIAIPMPPQIMMMGLGYESAAHSPHNHHYQQQYNSMLQHQKDWSGNNMYYGYPHPVAQNNNNKC